MAEKLAPPRESVVYFIQSGDALGPIKIGTAIDAGKRLRDLQCAHPYDLVILGTLPGGRAEEREFHQQFADVHIRGEWFMYAKSFARFIDETFGRREAVANAALERAEKAADGRAKYIATRAVAENAFLDALSRGVDAGWKRPRYPLCSTGLTAGLLFVSEGLLVRLAKSDRVPFYESIPGSANIAFHRPRVEAMAPIVAPVARTLAASKGQSSFGGGGIF